MKRIICFLCVVSLLLTSFTAFAAEQKITFGKKIENPNLALPVDERAVMKEGTVIFELEDAEYDNTMKVIDDEDASGGKALSVAASAQLQDHTTKDKPSIRVRYVAEKDGKYNIWLRTRSNGNNTYSTAYIDASGKDSYSSITFQYAQDENYQAGVKRYYWYKTSANVFAGVNYFNIKYRAVGTSYDKVVITDKSGWTPVGRDDSPLVIEAIDDSVVNLGAIPIFPKKGQHPRVFFTEKDIPELLARFNAPENKGFHDNMMNVKGKKLVGYDGVSNTDRSKLGGPSNYQSKAFLYALGLIDDTEAREMIDAFKLYISNITFDSYNATFGTRNRGEVLVACAFVYDWCYNLLTAEDKEFLFHHATENIAKGTQMGYPPPHRPILTSQGSETMLYVDQLSIAIAMYDEHPEWYNRAAELIFQEMLPANRYWNASGRDWSGGSYMAGRNETRQMAHKMFTALGYNGDLFAYEYAQVGYTMVLYPMLPNGVPMKSGDDWYWSAYTPDKIRMDAAELLRYAGIMYDDPILRYYGFVYGDFTSTPIPTLDWFLMYDENRQFASITEMPLTVFTKEPMSGMIARTSWQNGLNAPTAMVQYEGREQTIGDHQHRDLGAFQLWYKGMLALDGGVYDSSVAHYDRYSRLSVAHNVMLVVEPGEETVTTDNGQKRIPALASWINNTDARWEGLQDSIAKGYHHAANTKAQYAGPDSYRPKFSYMSSDLAPSYSSKVEEYERSVVFINLEDEDYPAALVVYDNMRTSDASFKKKWLLQTELEPLVDLETNTTTVVRTDNGQNGKLVLKTLIPTVGKLDCEKIGGPGKESWVNGTNYPVKINAGVQADEGKWRIELSPSAESQEDRFLNAMYVTDADRNLPELPMYREYGSNYTGVTIRDTMVTFSTSRANIESAVSLSVRQNGYDEVHCLMTDMATGKWRILGNGINYVAESKEGENSLAFTVPAGKYTVSKVNSSEDITLPEVYPSDPEYFGDFIVKKTNNLMYLPKPTKDVDGAPYLAVDGVVTQLDCKIKSVEGDKVTLVNTLDDTMVLTIGSTKALYNGREVELKHPPLNIYGEMYVTLYGFEKFLSVKSFRYDQVLKGFAFTFMKRKSLAGVDMSRVVQPLDVYGSEPTNENFLIDYSYDRDLSTFYLSAGEVFLEYDLGEVVDVEKVMMAFNDGTLRRNIFDIDLSVDGVNYTRVFSGMASGKTNDLETFRAKGTGRYLRVSGHGNDNGSSNNAWREVVIIKQKSSNK